MKSMTGYGKGMVAGEDFSVSVDLKTVNNRFLDIHLRVGSELAALEPSIKKRITARLSRGRVDVTVSMERAAQIAAALHPDRVRAGVFVAGYSIQDVFSPPRPAAPPRSPPRACATTSPRRSRSRRRWWRRQSTGTARPGG